ncbi:MAG: fructosamine kinase family protein [Ardenticatenaceae bacterium]|nr:fructosamine kinase family protein [Ardenticatenaceae bacterium]
MIQQIVHEALQIEVVDSRPLTGGSIARVYWCKLADGRQVVAKVDQSPTPLLSIEGAMLDYLRHHSSLPVPAVIYSEPKLLIMEYVSGSSHLQPPVQRHAAELLAELHQISAPQFGLTGPDNKQFDTLIGGLHQPNPPSDSWIDFFRERRLMYMAGEAALAGQLPVEMLPRLEKLANQLDRYLIEPEVPSLIHGDMWTTNILGQEGRVTAFIDPAIYYGDPEIELAFSTLFGTFQDPFFARYEEIRPLAPGFFEVRRDIYNLYPLLVHTRLFGGSYVQGVGRTLKRFGC